MTIKSHRWAKTYFLVFTIFSLLLLASSNYWQNIEGIPEIAAATSDLTVASCSVDDTSNTTCFNAISVDGGDSFALSKNSHIDAPFSTLSVSSVNSATLYYDSWATLSGTWGIYVKDARDGSVICSIDPAPEDLSETTNSVSCTFTPTQLSNGVWLYVINQDDKGPQSVNLDFVRLAIDYNPPLVVSVTVADGVVDYGSVALSTQQDTTLSGLDDTQIATNNGNVTENFNIKTSHATEGTGWAVGTTAGPDVFVHSFSINAVDWEALGSADTYETLATAVSASENQNFDLKIELPTATTDYVQKHITVTIQAVEF